MKTIYQNYTSLQEELGISLLTGEACAYSMRTLCDVNEYGRELVKTFFGMTEASHLAPAWNSWVNGKPSVGSVMLPRSVFPDLIIFELFNRGFKYVISRVDGSFVGYSQEEVDTIAAMKKIHDDVCSGRNPNSKVHVNVRLTSTAPSVGSRNVHAFTGRTV